MVDDGSVLRDTVVAVLKAQGVDVSEKQHSEETATTLIKGDILEVQFFPERVPRRLVMRLAHKFEIPPHYFWHPEMMREEERQKNIPPS